MTKEEKRKYFKELFEYLHQNNCYAEFYYNFKHNNKDFNKQWKRSREEIYYSNSPKQITASHFLSYAFVWANTMQGHSYWSELHGKAEINGK